MNHHDMNLWQLATLPFLLTINNDIDLRKHFKKGAKSCGSEAFGIGSLSSLGRGEFNCLWG